MPDLSFTAALAAHAMTTLATDDVFGVDDTSANLSGGITFANLQAAILGGIAGGAAGGSTYVVASSTAPAAIRAKADAVCSGTADQNTINSYLALGSVTLTDGDYNITAPIKIIKPGTQLRGTGVGEKSSQAVGRGFGTRIIPTSGFAGAAYIVADQTSSAGPVGQITIRDLFVYGNAATQGDGILVRSYQFYLENIFVYQAFGSGIVIRGYSIAQGDVIDWNTYDGVMHKIQCRSNGSHGLDFDYNAQDTYLSDSTFMNNTKSGIHRGGGASNQASNVQCYSNVEHGIHYESGGSRDKWVGCKIEHNDKHGVWFSPAATAGTSGVGFALCNFGGNGEQTTNTYSAISVGNTDGSSGTTSHTRVNIVGCLFQAADGSTMEKYAIDLSFYGQSWVIVGNQFGTALSTTGVVTGKINIGNATVKANTTIVGNQGVKDMVGSSAPTAAAGAGAGTSPPAPVVDTNAMDTKGTVTFGTGTSPGAAGTALVTVTYSQPHETVGSKVMVKAGNVATAVLNPFVSANDVNGFTVAFAAGAAAASQGNTVYKIDYAVVS